MSCDCHLVELCEYYYIPNFTKQTRNLLMIKIRPSLPCSLNFTWQYHCKNEKKNIHTCAVICYVPNKNNMLHVWFLYLRTVSVPLIEMLPFSVSSLLCMVRLVQCCHLACFTVKMQQKFAWVFQFVRVRTVSGITYHCRSGKSFKGQMMDRFLLTDCRAVLSGNYR